MQVGQFPASAANSLIEGYCDDFISLASILAQTLEQVSMRSIDIGRSADHLVRIESGMRELSEAIRDLIERGRVARIKGDASATNHDTQSLMSTASVIANCSDWLSPSQIEAGTDGANEPGESEPAKPANFSDQMAREFGTDFSERGVHDPITEMQLEETRQEAPTPVHSAPDTADDLGQPDDTTDLKGSNQTMPLLSVFQFIERMRKSGVITVAMPNEKMTFEFDRGCVQACTTTATDQTDRLGDILLELDTCDADVLAGIVSNASGKSSLQIGELIVRANLATNGEIMDALETQARRRFQRACDAEEATYNFVEGDARRTDGRIRIAPVELSYESSWLPA